MPAKAICTCQSEGVLCDQCKERERVRLLMARGYYRKMGTAALARLIETTADRLDIMRRVLRERPM